MSTKSTAKKPVARKTSVAKSSSTQATTTKTKAKAPRMTRVKTAPVDPALAQVKHVRDILDAKKGEAIRILDVRGVSSVTDHMILCTGLNPPHLRALADAVAKELRTQTPPVAPHRYAGTVESGWLVLDYFQFVIHLFTPELRDYYALERLWKDAPEA